MSDVRDITDEFIIPSDENYDEVLEGKLFLFPIV